MWIKKYTQRGGEEMLNPNDFLRKTFHIRVTSLTNESLGSTLTFEFVDGPFAGKHFDIDEEDFENQYDPFAGENRVDDLKGE